jgi:hypothetical protein
VCARRCGTALRERLGHFLGYEGAPDNATWGQDRLWRVEEEIRARLAAAPA